MRYFLYCSYDGAAYHGWQVQPNGISVQEMLEKALSTLMRTDISIVGAGRTDAGVNASLMVAHFDCPAQVDPREKLKSLNRFLPPDIAVAKIVRVRDDAHARFDALSRTYNYYISSIKSPLRRHYAYRYPTPLDYDKMNEAASTLFEYKDFTSFSKLHTDTKTNNCKIMKAEWRAVENPLFGSDGTDGGLWEFTIQADRFLRNMVRAVVGTLIDVGRGMMTIEDFRGVIERKDRCAAGTSVPGHALFLSNIEYPEDLFSV